MIKRIFAVLSVLLLPLAAFAQDKDFGIWYGASLNKGIVNKLDLNVSGMVRTFRNASKVEQGFLEAGVDYKINHNLSAAASYRLVTALEDDSKYHFQHKAFVDLKGNVKVSNFTFSGRFRFQARLKTYLVYVRDKYPDYTGRFKVKALYRTPSFPVNPYIYIESFCPMFAKADRLIGKNRYSAGVEFKISKMHSVELEYIFQRDYLPHISDISIISVNYDLKL